MMGKTKVLILEILEAKRCISWDGLVSLMSKLYDLTVKIKNKIK